MCCIDASVRDAVCRPAAPGARITERAARRYGYERDLLALLTQLARDMDRKIVRQKERAEQDNRPRALSADDREKLDALKARAAAPASTIARTARAPSGSPWGCGPMRRVAIGAPALRAAAARAARFWGLRALLEREVAFLIMPNPNIKPC